MNTVKSWLDREVEFGRVTRRDFVKFCGLVAGMFSLPEAMGGKIAHAIENQTKPPVIWLEFQDCAGNTEAFLRAARPTVAEVILDHIAVEYHETIMAAAGHLAEEHRARIIEEYDGQYIAVVEGSIPTGAGGAYCTVGGESAMHIAEHVCGHAAATIAIGTCAAFGGIPAAAPNPTGALSVADAIPRTKNLINLPACPANSENLVALIMYYLTFNRWPPMDQYKRPLFAYGKSIHDNCERRSHYDAGQYAEKWGDEGHREGYCLYKVGCKGPVTYQNCPVIRWNDGTDWPVGCGHPCIGCAEPDFWDKMTPFYEHIGTVPGMTLGANLDTIGIGLTAGTAAAFAGHGVIKAARNTLIKDEGREEAHVQDEGGSQ